MATKRATRDPEDARRRILAAAAQIFAEKGFEGARVDAIARRARVNKAMLYYHVGDKEALYEAVLLRNFKALGAAMDAAASQASDATGRFRKVLEALVSTLTAIPEHPRLMLGEIASGAAHLPGPVFREMAGIFGRIRSVLDEGRREGCFKEVDPLMTHLMVVGGTVFTLVGTRIQQHLGGEAGAAPRLPEDPARIARRIADLVLAGLLEESPEPVSAAKGSGRKRPPRVAAGDREDRT